MNEDIFGGLKSALERGDSLKKAMITFYNAGYKKEEIEEAARALEDPTILKTISQNPIASNNVQPKSNIPLPSVSPIVNSSEKKIKQTKQKASKYGSEKGDKNLVFILAGVLVFLLGVLVAIFLFKDQLISFFSSFFS